MEALLQFQDTLLKGISNQRKRFLNNKIDWNERIIAIKGPRGSGKTTLMLQHMKFDLDQPDSALYVTADHTWFYNHTLLDTAFDWSKQGGKLLIIDEVHKYPSWSTELKNIYDGFPQLKVIFSASSALDLYRGEADLSRRVITYELPGLSFREFLYFSDQLDIAPLSIDEIQMEHRKWSKKIIEEIHPLPLFNKYLKQGYLPFFMEGESGYFIKIEQIINTIIDSDLSYIQSYNAGTAVKLKKLLGVIAESVPFKPNISALARKLDLSRDSVYEYISQLTKARLINTLTVAGKGVSTLQKPEKIFIENTNYSQALKHNADKGNLRETFLLNQLLNAGQKVYAPESGDFLINDLIIEVGGKSKNTRQVKNYSNYLIAADDIETGSGIKIPLWLFGFLY